MQICVLFSSFSCAMDVSTPSARRPFFHFASTILPPWWTFLCINKDDDHDNLLLGLNISMRKGLCLYGELAQISFFLLTLREEGRAVTKPELGKVIVTQNPHSLCRGFCELQAENVAFFKAWANPRRNECLLVDLCQPLSHAWPLMRHSFERCENS